MIFDNLANSPRQQRAFFIEMSLPALKKACRLCRFGGALTFKHRYGVYLHMKDMFSWRNTMSASGVNASLRDRISEIKSEFETRVRAIKEKSDARISEMSHDAPDPSAFEAMINVAFEVKWRRKEIKFDIPKFTSKRETIKFDIPEVYMETEGFSFDVPAVRMKRKCIAKKPEFHGFKVKWTCIWADVPEPYMKRHEIKIDIPKFRSKRVEIKFDIPEVRMETVDISFDIPEFYVKDVDADISGYQDKINTLSQEMSQQVGAETATFKARMRNELPPVVSTFFDEMRDSMLSDRAGIETKYNDAISKLKASIRTLKENNVNDKVAELEGTLSGLISEYQQVLGELDQTIESLNEQEVEVLSSLGIA